jgi:hypothetical protein
MRNRRAETGNRKPEAGTRKSETGHWKSEGENADRSSDGHANEKNATAQGVWPRCVYGSARPQIFQGFSVSGLRFPVSGLA